MLQELVKVYDDNYEMRNENFKTQKIDDLAKFQIYKQDTYVENDV